MRRSWWTLAVCTVLVCGVAGTANAGPGLLVGVADDSLKWTDKTQALTALGFTRDLGIRAVRVTVPWQPGETRLPLDQRGPVDRMILATWGRGLRVVLSVYGSAADAPQTDSGRNDYCAFAASLLRRYPGVNDLVVWNEPNSSRFWQPQFAPDGTSLAPAAYEALLARCWDVLHSVRPSANVIAASSPRGSFKPSTTGSSHSPVTFYRKIGEAYRASGHNRPILDTVGHNPYPSFNAERPWARHPRSGAIGQGDYEKLMNVLEQAFGGTAQPLPGQGRVSIWYMEQGFQTTIDPTKASLYHGAETDRQALPAWIARATAGTNGPAPDQATQLTDALQLAYCQPAVGAFFNFELADETRLAGWQSGLLWADLTPKPSYGAFKAAVYSVVTGRVDCSRFEAASVFTTSTSRVSKRKAPSFSVK